MPRDESEAERDKLYAVVCEDEHWKTSISPRVGERTNCETINVQRIVPTTRSLLR